MSALLLKFTSLWSNSSLIRYCFSGGITAIIYFATLVIGHEFIGLNSVMSWWLAFSVAVPTTYLTHRLISFRSSRPHIESLPRFLLALTLNISLNSFVIHAGTEWLNLHYLIPQIVVAPMMILINFLVMRNWVFGDN